jgi:hypothetical protein
MAKKTERSLRLHAFAADYCALSFSLVLVAPLTARVRTGTAGARRARHRGQCAPSRTGAQTTEFAGGRY